MDNCLYACLSCGEVKVVRVDIEDDAPQAAVRFCGGCSSVRSFGFLWRFVPTVQRDGRVLADVVP